MTTTLRGLFAALATAGEGGDRMTVRLGKHGERVGLLGYGAMRIPTVDGGHANAHEQGGSTDAIDQKRLDEQVDYMLKHGVNYFDTSPAYCRGRSETALGLALSRHPRASYYISTKLSNFAASSQSFDASRKMFESSLKALKTDYVDYYYLHSIGSGGFANFQKRYIDNGIIPWLMEQKKLGRIRNIGFSYHGDPKAFEWCLKQHDAGNFKWDMALIQLNYVDWRHAAEVNKANMDASYLYSELTSRGIQATVMEPLLGGRLARSHEAIMAELTPRDPEATPASWAFRFAGSHENVLSILSGMTFQEHIEENIRTFSPLKPLERDDYAALERAAVAYLGYGAIPCNVCNYCMPCPYGLDIPGLLTFMNRVRTEKMTDPKAVRRAYEEAVPDPRRRADRCIGCAKCVSHCPQQIDIPKALDGIAAYMEDFA